jgi:hypothetical protein
MPISKKFDTQRYLLYVACTRAGDHLLVTGTGPVSEFLHDIIKGDRGCAGQSPNTRRNLIHDRLQRSKPSPTATPPGAVSTGCVEPCRFVSMTSSIRFRTGCRHSRTLFA